jgi:hypothetical protein
MLGYLKEKVLKNFKEYMPLLRPPVPSALDGDATSRQRPLE